MRRLACLTVILAAGCAGPGSLYDEPITTADGGVFLCEPEVAVNGTGHHNEGMSCLAAGCHRAGAGGGPAFTVAGTLYDDERGGVPVGGATIVVIDGDGQRLELPTAANGNFWTNQPVRMPLLLRASQCPLDHSMISLAQDGDCNRGGCHSSTDIRVALQ